MYVTPTGDGFEVYLAAAMVKKGVPVIVLDHEEGATYGLKAAAVETQKVGGTSKVVNCFFAYCAGNADKGNTSVQLSESGVVKWSYSVNKGRGEKNRQSMAEAIAKHLKATSFTAEENGTGRPPSGRRRDIRDRGRCRSGRCQVRGYRWRSGRTPEVAVQSVTATGQ